MYTHPSQLLHDRRGRGRRREQEGGSLLIPLQEGGGRGGSLLIPLFGHVSIMVL
jgi:hypothetical protein